MQCKPADVYNKETGERQRTQSNYVLGKYKQTIHDE